jgi:hypothetical protein
MASFEEEYFDVLKAIETAIVTTYAAQPEAKDRHVEAALSGLIRTYNAALKNKKPPRLKFNATEQALFDSVQTVMQAFMSAGDLTQPERTLSVDEAAGCVKRIQRSVGQMMAAGGPSGTKYLEFVRDYQNKAGEG